MGWATSAAFGRGAQIQRVDKAHHRAPALARSVRPTVGAPCCSMRRRNRARPGLSAGRRSRGCGSYRFRGTPVSIVPGPISCAARTRSAYCWSSTRKLEDGRWIPICTPIGRPRPQVRTVSSPRDIHANPPHLHHIGVNGRHIDCESHQRTDGLSGLDHSERGPSSLRCAFTHPTGGSPTTRSRLRRSPQDCRLDSDDTHSATCFKRCDNGCGMSTVQEIWLVGAERVARPR